MHKELVGQEALLSLPSTVDAADLLLVFIEELMEVDGGESSDPDRLESELREAIESIRSHEQSTADCNVVARFDIRGDGVDVRLTCENQARGDVGINELVVAAPEA